MLFKVFRVIPINLQVSPTLLRTFITSQSTRQRKSLLSEAGILSSQKPKQSNSCSILDKRLFFPNFLTQMKFMPFVIRYVRGMRAHVAN